MLSDIVAQSGRHVKSSEETGSQVQLQEYT